MKYLAVDYGLAHIGLAVSEGLLAEPYGQLDFISNEKLVSDIKKIILTQDISTVIIGISEGKMAQKTQQFANQLIDELRIRVELVDETLSSQDAKKKMVEANIKLHKRQNQDHQIAAALILQDYLDNKII